MPQRQKIELSLDSNLVAEAKAAGTDLSALLEKALREANSHLHADRWREENREAIRAWNHLVDTDGLWAEKYRS